MSGKRAKINRKKSFSKKALAMCAGLCLSCTPAISESEFLVSLFPHLTKPFGEAHSIEYGLGAGVKLTYRPIRYVNIFAEGDYLSLALPNVNPISLLNGSLGLGYHLDLTDRISFDLNLNGGAYTAAASGKTLSGISAGGSLVFSFKLSPVISLDTAASATHFAAGSSPLMMINPAISPGLTFNISKIFNTKPKMYMDSEELDPVFPVLYSWYENNSFGKVTITNNEDSSITDVTVSFFQPQYMAHAKECVKIPKLKRGQSVDVDLLAFFNEQILELREKTDTNSVVIVDYSYVGQKRSASFPLTVPVYGRNNMSWDDDRRAAVFVSSKDPAAMRFGKYVASLVRENLRYDVPINIQYALGIFEALNQFGLNYVVDPASAFEDNVGTSAIDFLQFPYQTLMYRGGDCDDISILVCSLFEAVGIDTAFITIPGHIYMAFDSGLTELEAMARFTSMRNYIVDDDRVWIPLEITLSDEGFYKALRVGAREWRAAEIQGTAMLYKMSDSWKLYQPISVPGATSYFNLPESELIALSFNTAIDDWSYSELRSYSPILAINVKEEDVDENETVIKPDPLSREALDDVLAYAYRFLALGRTAKDNELRRRDEDDDDTFPDDFMDSDPDFQVEYAVAQIGTDVPVKRQTQQTQKTEPKTEKQSIVPLPEIEDLPVVAEVAMVKPFSAEPVSELEEVSEFEIASTSESKSEPESQSNGQTQTQHTTQSQAQTTSLAQTSTETSLQPETETNSPANSTAKTVAISATALAATAAAGIFIFGKKKKKDEEGK